MLAGLANGRGGTLLVGIRDDGMPVGIQAELGPNLDRDAYELSLFTKLKDCIGVSAASAVQLHFQQHGEALICVLRIPPSPVPVYVKHDGQQLLFARVGNQCLGLDAAQALSYSAKRWPG